MANTNQISFSRELPVKYDVDVCIAGGGPAGIAAALAAAAQNAKVFLLESSGCFGGMGTCGLVPAFMRFSDGVNFLADGVGKYVYTELKKSGHIYNDQPGEWVSINVEILKRVYDSMITGANIDFSFNTTMIAVEKTDNKVTNIICAAKSGLFAVNAKVFVDCTGDGDLAAWAGAKYEKGDEKGDEKGNLMPATLCSLWADVDTEKAMSEENIPFNKHVEKAYENGIFTTLDRHLPGIWPVGQNIGGGNIGHCFGVDGTDEKSVTKGLIHGRKITPEYERYFKEYLKGYENMKLVSTAPALGLRESRRIIGDYILSVDDYRKRAVFEDEIGRYCYPVDIHASSPDEKSYRKFEKQFMEEFKYQEGQSYGIPYRTLTPAGLENVLVAGRCVSADRYVAGSIRVMPGCFITGQAAGIAAALAAMRQISVHKVDVPELQKRLKDFGAYLPNN